MNDGLIAFFGVLAMFAALYCFVAAEKAFGDDVDKWRGRGVMIIAALVVGGALYQFA